jgi:hypothetical protein
MQWGALPKIMGAKKIIYILNTASQKHKQFIKSTNNLNLSKNLGGRNEKNIINI